VRRCADGERAVRQMQELEEGDVIWEWEHCN
jgi:hypothetical protein